MRADTRGMSHDAMPPTRIRATCPGCGEWDPPSEILEPRTGPKLSWDDLLDLHLELESPDWWGRFQAACR
jgi:hypothetical protein